MILTAELELLDCNCWRIIMIIGRQRQMATDFETSVYNCSITAGQGIISHYGSLFHMFMFDTCMWD